MNVEKSKNSKCEINKEQSRTISFSRSFYTGASTRKGKETVSRRGESVLYSETSSRVNSMKVDFTGLCRRSDVGGEIAVGSLSTYFSFISARAREQGSKRVSRRIMRARCPKGVEEDERGRSLEGSHGGFRRVTQ